MDRKSGKEIRALIKRIEAVDSKTFYKIDALKSVVLECDQYIKDHYDTGDFTLEDEVAKISRLNSNGEPFSQKAFNTIFTKIKKDILAKIRNTYLPLKRYNEFNQVSGVK